MKIFVKELCLFIIVLFSVPGLKLPDDCKSDQYYDSSTMQCQSCPANVSMITSSDGFGCTCKEHSIPVGKVLCKPCNATEVVSADGATCVPRRCQTSAGRTVCRKCPNDYISVTQNFDGSPMKEVLCVKCARGYKAQDNRCFKCESCTCARNEIVIRGRCVPKRYVLERPKYEENQLHPYALLDIVKHEYFCTRNDSRACCALANECVKNFYTTDSAGPCRLWIQPNSTHKGLPKLVFESTTDIKNAAIVNLFSTKEALLLAVAAHTSEGRFNMLQDSNEQPLPCFLPTTITIGNDFSYDCNINLNISKARPLNYNDTLAPYLYVNGEWQSLPVKLRKPNGYYVQKGAWSTNKFKRYFLTDNVLSITANVTNMVYLRTLLVYLRIERDKISSLRVHVSLEAQYELMSPSSPVFTSTLMISHDLPYSGVLSGLEIVGGVLGALLALYSMVQYRGVLKRGGHYYSIVPILAGSVADTLYFAAWFSTLHALAAEAGTLGLMLPMSKNEEHTIKAFIYSAVSLKILKVAWVNWKQCRCDIFFLDWSQYNSPLKDVPTTNKSNEWKIVTVAREWSLMQTTRKASPGFTVILTLIILHLLSPWQSYLPKSQSYLWAVATSAWWFSYITVILIRWIMDRFCDPPSVILPRVCANVEISLLVFQEEYYAHYVHGRNDFSSDSKSMSGPLASCRIICAPQLRAVSKLLSTSAQGLDESDTKQEILSKFLAAFFERALDGLSWVANERTILERLLDMELTVREASNTSTLLYDSNDNTPSCYMLTWWGEEWTLGTFDAMLFGCTLIATDEPLLAILITVILWQAMKFSRLWFGNRNLKGKTGYEIIY